MKNFLIAFFFSFIAAQNSIASERVQLKHIASADFKEMSTTTESIISKDINKSLPTLFDQSQSFNLNTNNQIDFKFLPITYNSLRAKNNVCALAVFSSTNQFREVIPLHFVYGDADEVVESCVGVQAVSSLVRSEKKLLVYLLRNRYGNQYRDAVFIASLESEGIKTLPALSECVSNKNPLDSNADVRKAIDKCWTRGKSSPPNKR